MTPTERRERTWPFPQRWKVCGDDVWSLYRDYSFLYSFEEAGVWVYIELVDPQPGDNRPYQFGDFWYFKRRQDGLDFLKRKIKQLCHGDVYSVPPNRAVDLSGNARDGADAASTIAY